MPLLAEMIYLFSNPDTSSIDSETEGNPFGGNPFEFNPTAEMPDSSNVPAESTFPVGEVPEGLSNEELAVSSQVAGSEEMLAEGGRFSRIYL